jgi:hypothetical protein
MAKTFTKSAITFLLSSLLAIGSLASPDYSWPDYSLMDQKGKEKGKEPIPEKPKGGGDRGGKGDDKDKKDNKKGGKKP